jgi:acyl carrier protein
MDTFNKIRELISINTGIDIERIKPETKLEELNIDSLEMFQIIFEAEEIFDVKIENLENEIYTVQDIVNLIEVQNDK